MLENTIKFILNLLYFPQNKIKQSCKLKIMMMHVLSVCHEETIVDKTYLKVMNISPL